MPWQGVTPVELRLEFNRAFATGRFSMTDLCEQYGISRKTAYKWIARFEQRGVEGLVDRCEYRRAATNLR